MSDDAEVYSTVDVPGKVVLVGEYAVLDGGTAVVAAVNIGVSCIVTPANTRRHHTPGDDRFAAAALDAVNAPAGIYTFSDFNAPKLQGKAGLGASAATVVAALIAAGVAKPWPLAAQIHRRVQGSGSGIDVAASCFGGVLSFNGTDVRALQPVAPVIVWSGSSASTGPRVAQFLAWKDRRRFLAQMAGAVAVFDADPVSSLCAARAALAEMARDSGVDWATPAHDQIAAEAAACGGAAKPSGAGGGDIAVALFPDADREAHFRRRMQALGFPVLNATLSGAPTQRWEPG